MVDMNLIIYALSGVTIVLALILGTRLAKRRKSKPENIWSDLEGFPVMSRPQTQTRRPMRPPQAQMFNNR